MLIQLRLRTSPHWFLPSEISSLRKARSFRLSTAPFCPFISLSTFGSRNPTFTGRERSKFQVKGIRKIEDIEAGEAEGEADGELNKGEGGEISSGGGNDNFGGDFKGVDEEFANASAYRGRRDEKDFDKDPEIADILGNCFDDPKKAQSKVEERIRKKRNKIVQTKTGSATPMKVRFNKFNFSNSYIWIEFYIAPLPQDVTLICDTVRAWHIIGRLGGCNSMNMQLSQSAMDNKRPRYDAIQGANVTPTTFYNIGDLELQDNLARIWVDIGTSEPLLLDVLVNALSSISSDYVGIKQVIFGGSEFQSWKESLVSEEAGCSTHRI